MQHVLVDLYGCDPDRLADREVLHHLLATYPARLGMVAVSPVNLRHISATSDPRDAGYSGFIIIATSHVSLHAWPPYGMLNLDLFSCEPFDAELAVAAAVEAVGARDVELRVVERATRSPRAATGLASVA
jgi:S-adenosylmethionine decarboxylase